MKECVYLIGCRAVGKSSVGRKLARKLSYTFLDTDIMITENRGQSVAEIVAKDGWTKFREYEKNVLRGLSQQQKSVVATGGGAILHSELWPFLKKTGTVIWLTASLDVLCQRIRRDEQSESLRPSLTGKDICRELGDVLDERYPLYKAMADFTVDTGTLSIDEALSEIEHYLKQI